MTKVAINFDKKPLVYREDIKRNTFYRTVFGELVYMVTQTAGVMFHDDYHPEIFVVNNATNINRRFPFTEAGEVTVTLHQEG